MTDNEELVHFEHGGINFSALVELIPDDEVVAIFYDECDVTALLRLMNHSDSYSIERLAVKAAMKKRADKAEFDKWSDEK